MRVDLWDAGLVSGAQCVLKQAVVSHAVQLDVRKFELTPLLCEFLIEDTQLVLQRFSVLDVAIRVPGPGGQLALGGVAFASFVQGLVDAVVVL